MIKKGQYGPSPIPLPDPNPGIGAFRKHVMQVRKAIAALRDRQVYLPVGSTPQQGHPWKVTANGDDTVTVADGSVIYFDTGGGSNVPNSPITGKTMDYTSASVTITAPGTLYVKMDFDPLLSDELIAYSSTPNLSTYAVTPTAITAELDPTLSGDEVSIPIATVTLTDGIAAVTKQILSYNPPLSINYCDA